MRTIIFSLSLVTLLCDVASSATVYNAKGFGHVISEWHVFRKGKDKTAQMLGKDSSSKGIQALRANDIAKNARKKIKQGQDRNVNDDISEILNNEYFVVAKVADEVITNVDIINAIRFIFFSSGRKFDKRYARMMVKPILDALIEDKIRQRLASLNGLNISDEVNKKIEEIAKNNMLTIEQLGKEFEKAGISMVIFKRNVASKLVFSGFFQSMSSSVVASPEAIEKEKKKYKTVLESQRYKIAEIFFRADSISEQKIAQERAEAVVDLLKEGFSFSALAEGVSQADTEAKISEAEWKTANTMDRVVFNAIGNLKPGEYTGVIKVRCGYKIVQVIDSAAPNKEGISKSTYRVVVAEIPTPTPTTEDEAMSLQMSVNTIAEADSVEMFKRACGVYGFKMMETTVTDPDAVQRELIMRNKSTGKSGIIRVAENEPLVALFVVSEDVPDAKFPDNKFFSDMIINRKAVNAFVKAMKRNRLMFNIKVEADALNKVISDK